VIVCIPSGSATALLLLLLAVRNDSQFRIFYVSIILASLTVNITEFFPVNFILGLLLARGFSMVKKRTVQIGQWQKLRNLFY
jgi:hypothetical protein